LKTSGNEGAPVLRRFSAFGFRARFLRSSRSENLTLAKEGSINTDVLESIEIAARGAVFDCRIGYKLQKISKEARGRLQACHSARW
jgi:hypothetical protein